MTEPTYTKQMLSQSVNGRQIKVGAVASPGTLIHTAVAGSVNMDEVWIYINNNGNSDLACTIEWGGSSNPDDLKQMAIPAKQGDYLVIPGYLLNGGLTVRVYAETTNLLCVSGWVNRITP